MKIRIFTFCAILVTALMAVTACMEKSFREPLALLSSDLDEIVAPAQPEAEEGSITRTLNLTSNRTWSAELSPESDWVSISRDSRVNLSGMSENITLVLEFSPYLDSEPRSTTLLVTIEGGKLSIPVIQNGCLE